MTIRTYINTKVRVGLYNPIQLGVLSAYALDKLRTSADVDATVEYHMYVNELEGIVPGVRDMLSMQEDLLTTMT
jgi:hypothetical protein